ncbi:MAG: O-acetylhomoserine aminocarboxypropyltransferase [Gammaproteobacteria bacterium]
MSGPRYLGFDTLSLHGGQEPDATTGARAQPIYQTVAFVFRDQDEAASRFGIARSGHVYSRISNPTVAVLEERLAMLENGVGAVATASGMAAIHLAIATLAGSGSHIVASRALYGGTHNLLSYTLPRFGIDTTFVDPRDPAAFAAAVRPETVLMFGETVANPGCEVLDIPAVAARAHEAGVPLVIDSTLTTPALIKPLDLGADLVVHSLTKFIGGHGATLGGVLIDGGRFDWLAHPARFPTLCAPYAGFHDTEFAAEFGPSAYIIRARREGLRDFGAALPAHSAFELLQGLETLSLRMDRHVRNAQHIAEYLAAQEGVSRVSLPTLPGHPDHALAGRLMPRGTGAVFSFEIEGGRAAGRKLIESLQIFSHLANVGDAKSLVIHPASTTHSRMDDDALAAAGISPGLVRLSIGLEAVEDLTDDLARALYRARK